MSEANGNSNGNNSLPPQTGNGQSSRGLISDFATHGTAFLSELDIRREGIGGDGVSDGSNGQFARWPYGYGEPLWRLGWTDGRLGEPREKHENVIRGWCKLQGLREIAIREERIARAKGELSSFKENHSRTTERLTEASNQLIEISTDKASRYSEFSYSVAVIYLFVSLFLFLADIPLTLKLVAKGFDLKTQVFDDANKVILSVDDLILRPRAVTSQLWEPVILALGIALVGVFVKIFLDELILSKGEDKPKKLKYTLIVVLVLFGGTILSLGFFRSRIQTDLQSVSYKSDRDKLKALYRSQGLDDDEIVKKMGSESPPKEESWLSVLTFSALTFTLPIVAGVCFAIGWRRLKDASRFTSLRWRKKRLELMLDVHARRMNSRQAEVEVGELWLARQRSNDNLIDAETEWAISVFQHGYYRGVSLPETLDHGATLFNRVEKSAEKIFARKMRDKLWRNLP
jgi:hypothetical protein